MITQKDIARHVGVSRSTVVQALNGIGRVNAETRERVLQGARELGYRPNPLARALVMGRTNTIAFWFDPYLDSYVATMANRMQSRVKPYSMVITNVASQVAQWREQGEEEFPPAQWPVDGIIAFRTGPLPDWIVGDPDTGSVPMVYIGYGSVEGLPGERTDAVIVHLQPAAEAAVRHLVRGRRRVAMFCVEPIAGSLDERAVAYEKVMREAGREPEYIRAPLRLPWRQRAVDTMHAYVSQHGCPDAIFCASDEQSTGINLALSQMGQRVPQDVALIGCDGLEDVEFHVPPLSTLAQPFEEMCDTAWSFLQKRIEEPDAPRQVADLYSKLVLRASSLL